MNYDNSLRRKPGQHQLKAGSDGAVEVAVTESKSYAIRKISGLELIKPSFFDNYARGISKRMTGNF